MRYPSLALGLLCLVSVTAVLVFQKPFGDLPSSLTAASARVETHRILPAPALSPEEDLQAVAATLHALPLSASLKSVFPELTAGVSDWREFCPEVLVLQLDPDLRVPFQISMNERTGRRTVLTGHLDLYGNPSSSLQGSYFVATAVAADRWDGVIVLPGMEYRVTVRGGQASVEEHVASSLVCATDVAPPSATATAGAPAATITTNTPPAGLTVDVLFLYNIEALAERNNDLLALDADASNYIAASNAVLRNSLIDSFSWRYLGIEAAPTYATSENTLDDLRAMRGTGSIASFVDTRQKALGADQVVLLAGGRKLDAVGRAWVGGSVAHSVISYPYVSYGDGFRSKTVTSYVTVCHELAHNFGCNHQREDSSTEARDGDGQYNYAHVTKGKYGLTGSIMAVHLSSATMTRVPYFSHPEVSNEGQPLGIAINQPRAAYNALVVRDNAARIAALNTPPAPPAIVEQPQSVTVFPGDKAVLSVKATGDELSYQWLRNGVALTLQPGQGVLTFSPVNASQAGEYTVIISNAFGSVTSLVATIQLIPVLEPVSPAGPVAPVAPAATELSSAPLPTESNLGSSSTTGDSGGGSTGSLGVLVLGALVGLRFLMPRRG